MRALPEHAAAAIALAEIIEGFRYTRREFPPNLGFRDGLQDAVAGHAAGKRPNGAGQIKSVNDLGQLRAAVGLAQPIPVRNSAALEQSPIPGEERAVLRRRDAG